MTLTNNRSKLIRSLSSKKNRQEHKLFLAEGRKIIKELKQSELIIEDIYLSNSAYQSEFPESELISEKELKKMSSLSNPDGVLAVVKIPEVKFDKTLALSQIIPVLDGINDPGNLGTMMRIADWFGFKNLICSSDTVDLFNPKCVQASMGSLSRVNVHYLNLREYLSELSSDIPVYGTLLNGESIYEANLSKHGLLVIGSESHGIRENILPHIKNAISIPSFGKAESLNAAMAMAISCSEFKRRDVTPQK